MIRVTNDPETMTAKRVLVAILCLMLLSAFLPGPKALSEDLEDDDAYWDSVVILDDPALFMFDELKEVVIEESIPVITSKGKKNVKVGGVKSKGKLVNYTIPEQLLRNDPDFLALMIEAEKYIGYPYVYGAANPDTGFDCSGFVCWVFRHSGVYNIKRMGANGLYSLCQDVAKEDVRPGDLVFFEKTMGASVKGITHVGIYVGNNMMIHAGDPVGFADLKSDQWAKKIYGYGRLPID